MEFFQSLYPEDQINHFIKNLKELQEVLGNFQDLTVQENTLKLFKEEMQNNNIHPNTILAMDALIQNLETFRAKARKDFSSKFANFKHEENPTAFKSLLAAKDGSVENDYKDQASLICGQNFAAKAINCL
jgi:CHAD domain-containing protein